MLAAQAWQTPFPPNQTGNHFWERPAVHNGFYQSYTANDFGRKIVRRVCELITSNDWDWTKVSSTCDLNPLVSSLNVCKTAVPDDSISFSHMMGKTSKSISQPP